MDLKSAGETRSAQEAAEWFLRVERGDASTEELMSWQQWMERSPAHRVAYESVQRTWQKLDSVNSLPWPTDAEVAHDQTDDKTAAIPIARRTTWRPWAAAACVAILGAGAVLLQSDFWRARNISYRSDISTEIAEHRQLRLPDGSRIQVGARTDVEVDFSPRRRSIRLLSGEAFFSVVKDAIRPFVVEAGSSRVTAIGTAFNVRCNNDAVTVEVAEGQVRLETDDARSSATALRPGQEAMVDNSGALQAVRSVPAEQIAAWRTGQHRYIDTPLSTVIADLNRYSTRTVAIDDLTTGALRITTTFFSDDSDGWLDTLEMAVPSLRVQKTGTTVHISMR